MKKANPKTVVLVALAVAACAGVLTWAILTDRQMEREERQAVDERVNQRAEAERQIREYRETYAQNQRLWPRYRQLVLKGDREKLVGAELEEYKALRERLVDKPARERDEAEARARQSTTAR